MSSSLSKNAKDILQLKEKLDKLVDQDTVEEEAIVDILKTLRTMPITLELLRTTKIGQTLQEVKKKGASAATASKTAKELIAQWKKDCSTPSSSDTTAARTGKREVKPVVRYEEEAVQREVKRIGNITVYPEMQPIPKKNAKGYLVFPDYPNFRPNLTPKEVMQMGSFGGTYFRIIKSGVTGETYRDAWKEFPADWFEGLNIAKQVSSQHYDVSKNRYKEQCGGGLDMWESSGWITAVDPFGWFQWYCRFYLGRRCSDDERQISRGLGVMGTTGRWRSNLVKKCLATGKKPSEVVNDHKISPKVRQLLQVSLRCCHHGCFPPTNQCKILIYIYFYSIDCLLNNSTGPTS